MCGVFNPTNVISLSYGGQESDVPISYQKRQCLEYMKLGLQGVSFLFASGDSGVSSKSKAHLSSSSLTLLQIILATSTDQQAALGPISMSSIPPGPAPVPTSQAWEPRKFTLGKLSKTLRVQSTIQQDTHIQSTTPQEVASATFIPFLNTKLVLSRLSLTSIIRHIHITAHWSMIQVISLSCRISPRL